MQNFGVTNNEHHGMLYYSLLWSIEKMSSPENKGTKTGK